MLRYTAIALLGITAACLGKGTATTALAQSPPPESAPLSEKLRATYEQALPALLRESNLAKLNAILQSAANEYPIVNICSEDSAPVWNTLTLNTAGQQFDAVRFSSPLNVPADMLWAFGTPGNNRERWHILPAQGEMQGFDVDDIQSERNVDVDGAELPEPNFWVFQQLRGGQIKPGQEYILWFASPEVKPRTVHVTIRLVPAGNHPDLFSSGDIARAIGIKWHGPAVTPGSVFPKGHRRSTGAAQFTPDGQLLAYCGADSSVKSWDKAANVWRPLLTTLPGPEGTKFALDPTSKIVVTGGIGNDVLEVWDLAQRSRLMTIPAELETIAGLRFSADGKTLACSWTDSTDETERRALITFWDLTSRSESGRIAFDDRWAGPVDFTPDGKALLVANGQIDRREGPAVHLGAQFLSIWDVASGRKTFQFEGIQGSLQAVRVLRDGQRMVAIEGYHNLCIWDLPGRRLKTVTPFSCWINDVAISPDEQQLALAMNDGIIRIWDMNAGRTVAVWFGHVGPVSSIAYSPDGAFVAAGGADGVPRIWPVPPRAERYERPLCGYPAGTLTDSLGLKFVPIPAGRFLMGSPATEAQASEDEHPTHKVRIADPFLLSAHEVTVAQFRQFVDATGYRTSAEQSGSGGRGYDLGRLKFVAKPAYNWRNPGFPQEDDHPVVQVSWDDAQAFCQWLSEKEGAVYRLPTEAEWEYACRAGTKTPFPWGESPYELMEMGNTGDQSMKARVQDMQYKSSLGGWNDGFAYTAPVGSFLPNAFGLYDMHGNVYEWCLDLYEARAYAETPPTRSTASTPAGSRVCRGGAFWYGFGRCRSAARGDDLSSDALDCRGFRPVRDSEASGPEETE